MIAYFSEWAKNLTLAVVIVSLFEMLLPNNKTKKYVKVVMGLYILFNIMSPFVKKDFSFELENVIENSKSKTVSTEVVNQTSMDTRLKQICKEELEKDITKKVEKQGYVVENCKVDVKIEEDTNIKKITLKVKKSNEEIQKEEKQEENDIQLVKEVQKIKKVQIGDSNQENKNVDENLSAQDISNIKNFLIKEYEVNEKCLKIN